MSANFSAIPAPDFSDAWAKLDRARHHIADVESHIGAFLSTDLYALRLEPYERNRRVKVVFDSLHQPGKVIQVLVGDAVGNLRSVLDYIAVALTYPITGQTKNTGFPFTDDANGFSGEVRASRCLGVCAAKVQAIFIDGVQAYYGGAGHSFWTVNKLRNIDKHRLLVATTHVAGFTMKNIHVGSNTIGEFFYRVSAGQSGTALDVPSDFQFAEDVRTSFDVHFGEIEARNVPVSEFQNVVARETEILLKRLQIFSDSGQRR